MQAAWGQENGAPKPARGGELYGEVGRWAIASIESVPWYATRKERIAQNKYTHEGGTMRKWDDGKSTMGSNQLQNQSTKRPAQMDVTPQGVKVTLGSKPGVMTMADHDHGEVWPPAKGHECDLPFQAMVKERKPDFHTEVNGIMIGYQGHVPRARDKVGSCPLGRVPGRPGAPSLSGDQGLKQSSQSVKGSKWHAGPHPLFPPTRSKPRGRFASLPRQLPPDSGLRPFYLPLTSRRSAHPPVLCPAVSEPPLYMSEARDPQLAAQFKPGQRIHASMDPNDTYKGGVPPGYAGHVHGSRYQIGQSVFSTADTYGHPDSQGATAKQFSSHNDARGANFEEMSSIYAGGFVADGLPDDPRDSFILDDGIAGNKGQKPMGASSNFQYVHG